MLILTLLTSQLATALLAAGSWRGSGLIFRKRPMALIRHILQITGLILLTADLLLTLRYTPNPTITLITWPGILSANIILTALLLPLCPHLHKHGTRS